MTLGRVSTSSSKRCTPEGPAPSDEQSRFDPIPMLMTATGVPSGSVDSRFERSSGKLAF